MSNRDFANIVTPSGGWDENGKFYPRTTVTPEQMEAARQAESARIAKAIAERQAREAREAQEREAREQAAGAAELEAYMAQAKAAYLASGGDLTGWNAGAAAKLRAEYLLARSRERLTWRERREAEYAERLRQSGGYTL